MHTDITVVTVDCCIEHCHNGVVEMVYSVFIRCDCEENLERQRNEIMALTSIYDDQFTVLPRSGKGYRVKLEVDLPGPYRIREPHEG